MGNTFIIIKHWIIYSTLMYDELYSYETILLYLLQRVKYFLDLINYLEWILYVSTVFFVLPFLCSTTPIWQWIAGAIAVFLAWFNCLLFLRRY